MFSLKTQTANERQMRNGGTEARTESEHLNLRTFGGYWPRSPASPALWRRACVRAPSRAAGTRTVASLSALRSAGPPPAPLQAPAVLSSRTRHGTRHYTALTLDAYVYFASWQKCTRNNVKNTRGVSTFLLGKPLF